jgi:hypothetical protein
VKTTILFIILLLLLATTSYSQVSPTPTPAQEPPLSKEDYLKKSRSQNIAGVVLIAGGGVLLGSGFVALLDEALDGTGRGGSNGLVPGLLIGGSVASFVLGGVSLVSASRNKKKALSLTAGRVQFPWHSPKAFSTQSAPTAGLKITF